MSKAIFVHEHKVSQKVGETKESREEVIKDTDKGLFIKLVKLSKGGKKEDYHKITIFEESADNFKVTEKKEGGEPTEKTVDKKGLADLLKKNKDLSFANDYVTKEQKKFRDKIQKGGKKSSKRKTSKKKASKKTSKRTSKKSSKKASKKKASKKTKKKSSKKSSKK